MAESPLDPAAFAATLAGIVGKPHLTLPAADAGPGAPPVWRVAPGSDAEISALLRAGAAHGVAMTPAGSATQPRMQLVPTRPTVLISTVRMCHVVGLDEHSLTAHVQVGLTGTELERQLAPRGLTLGDYPPVVLRSTLGGIVAVRTHGKSSARYGFFEDNVLGLSAVLADGRTIHTRVAPRRSTGPDLARALCGSEGVLGFITSVVLRLHRAPEARFVCCFIMPSVDAAVATVRLALREEAAPSGVRIYDSAEARSHFPDLELPDGGALVVAATAGPTDLAACDRDLFTSAALAERGRPGPPALADLWWRRLHAGAPTPVGAPTVQLMATPSRVLRVYHAARDAAGAAGLTVRTHIARFDADGAVLFFSLVDAAGAPVTDDAPVAALVHAAEGAGGFPLGARSLRLDPYLHALRTAMDPAGIMNPEALA